MPTQRTYVYIDGFNLYYRALKGTPYKWLDLKTLFSHLLAPHNDIKAIKYFTTIVSGKIDPTQPIRQKTYIRALEKHIPEISVYYGHFLTHDVYMPMVGTNPPQFVNVLKTEEKGSDVNLAVHFLNDAWLDKFDCAAIVSNDSDLAEAMRLVKKQTSKRVGVITPVKYPSKELIQHADFVKRIRYGVLSVSQLPSPIPGTTLSKPASW
jgi:uncharacterized LabA/DUF88 family protein